MAGRREQIGNAVAHQPAATDSNFYLFGHFNPRLRLSEALGTALRHGRLYSGQQTRPARTEVGIRRNVMPMLLWVAIWSSMLGTASCWGEVNPIRIDNKDRD